MSDIRRISEILKNPNHEMRVSRNQTDIKNGEGVWTLSVCFYDDMHHKYWIGRGSTFSRALKLAIKRYDSKAKGVNDEKDI